MRLPLIALSLIAVGGLVACTASNVAPGPDNRLTLCSTDLKDDYTPNTQPPSYLEPSDCSAGYPGGEMFDRKRGFVGPVEGIGITVAQIWNGFTGRQDLMLGDNANAREFTEH